MVNCPNCDAVIEVDEDDLDEGDTLTCELSAVTDLQRDWLGSLGSGETEEDEDERRGGRGRHRLRRGRRGR